MTKRFSRGRNFDDYEFEDETDSAYNDELTKRRKMKRIKSALRTKNVDDLMDLDDYY
jgi:hypothetical protein